MSVKSREKLEEKLRLFKPGFQPEPVEASQAQVERFRVLKRTQRLNFGLTAAIVQGDAERIKHWQKMLIKFYNIPIGDWYASQIEPKHMQEG